MDRQSLRHTLEQLAAVLELKGEHPLRARPLRDAAGFLAFAGRCRSRAA